MIVNDKAAQAAKRALCVLEEQLDSGRSEALTQYLSFLSRFHNYSWNNVLLILFQKGDATHVAGYQSWKKMGRYVKQGEKGIAIFVPLKVRAGKEEGGSEPERNGSEEDGSVRLAGFTTGYVFDVSQTEGAPLPSFCTVKGDPGIYLQRLKELYRERGVCLEYSGSLGGAKGLSSGGRVEVLEGLEEADEFAVLVHELAHELLHRGPRREETDRRIRELEAEAVCFVVTTAVGLDNGTASSDYIQLYQGDSRLLARSLSFIQHTSAEILDFLL